jgi:hypothetical protein
MYDVDVRIYTYMNCQIQLILHCIKKMKVTLRKGLTTNN